MNASSKSLSTPLAIPEQRPRLLWAHEFLRSAAHPVAVSDSVWKTEFCWLFVKWFWNLYRRLHRSHKEFQGDASLSCCLFLTIVSMLAYCHFLRCFHADSGEREQDHLRFASFFGFKLQFCDIVMLGLFKDVNAQLEKSDSPLEISRQMKWSWAGTINDLACKWKRWNISPNL